MLLLVASTWTACDVHELPNPPERTEIVLRLNHETGITFWSHQYDGTTVKELSTGPTLESTRKYGFMRYVIRTYPVSGQQRSVQDYVEEFVLIRNLSDGYDRKLTISMLPGEYTIMIWSDLLEKSSDASFHDAHDFSEISLQGKHQGNNDYRDAFRGTQNVDVYSSIQQRVPDTIDVIMQRPLARFEFVTTDLQEFVDKEIEYLTKMAETRGEESPTRVEFDNYRVIFQYAGFMPDTYNMFTDKPVDSSTGVLFESKMNVLNEKEASLGFDYVFVNGRESGVSVQVGIYDKDGRQLSLTEPMNVPLRRNHNTILRGSFLMQRASGGITIKSEFEGNLNIEIQ